MQKSRPSNGGGYARQDDDNESTDHDEKHKKATERTLRWYGCMILTSSVFTMLVVITALGISAATFASTGPRAHQEAADVDSRLAAINATLVKMIHDDAPYTPEFQSELAPDLFNVTFRLTTGFVTVLVNRSWSPHGADRLKTLCDNHYFDNAVIYRAIPDYFVQFGIASEPGPTHYWIDNFIPDESPHVSNTAGTLSFAALFNFTTNLATDRSSQLFFNIGNNSYLDDYGFTPIGVVVEGYENLLNTYMGYGEYIESHYYGKISAYGIDYALDTFPYMDVVMRARALQNYPELPGQATTEAYSTSSSSNYVSSTSYRKRSLRVEREYEEQTDSGIPHPPIIPPSKFPPPWN
jgi:cyclophilin family peptidyl-prolyl cis-trans isomerase